MIQEHTNQSKTPMVLIIGASHGGVNLAFNLRQQGWQGNITLIDRDTELPYHRPPLSKKTIQSVEVISSPLKPLKAYADNDINLMLGQTVAAIDKQTRVVTLANGTCLDFDKLVIATGCQAFIPPIAGLHETVNAEGERQYFSMRTFADAIAIKAALNQSEHKRVVIIGGGYIGLECAASFMSLGANVTVIEKQPRILSRVTSVAMSDFLTQLHLIKGVELTTGKDVVEVVHQNQPLAAGQKQDQRHTVVCSDGSQYPADFILVGVGVRLNTELAKAANLTVEQGINVNEVCQTSSADIFAIGDCSQHYSQRYQRWIRLESVQNAVEQAKVAAQFIVANAKANIKLEANTEAKSVANSGTNLNSRELKSLSVPWFWSDQYEYKLQIIGLSEGYDQYLVRQESFEQFSVWYFSGNNLLCVEAVNHAKAYVLGTQAIKLGLTVNKTILSEQSTPLSKETLFNS
ncbi:NAD(P)/FAD-dependent oxidoreductase [uncultured Shewanella sp.]|uniref:NAD(P)/FAD-dependent oxidoreductase n=1 Tax=uncultured Shewanella sp. TaxID=173975 RepID=UPI00260877F8|nr:FAD-dependent oxidoreductase [uncultured Shewanella sp.]